MISRISCQSVVGDLTVDTMLNILCRTGIIIWTRAASYSVVGSRCIRSLVATFYVNWSLWIMLIQEPARSRKTPGEMLFRKTGPAFWLRFVHIGLMSDA